MSESAPSSPDLQKSKEQWRDYQEKWRKKVTRIQIPPISEAQETYIREVYKKLENSSEDV